MLESKYLKENIQNIQKLMTIPSLRNFEAQNLGSILKLSKIRQYENGEAIIKEGDLDAWLYFLLGGKIRIVKDGIEIGSIDQQGEIFGEMGIIENRTRSASVFAVGKTVCLAVDMGSQERMRREEDSTRFLVLMYRVFAEYMSTRLRLTTEELIETKRKLEEKG